MKFYFFFYFMVAASFTLHSQISEGINGTLPSEGVPDSASITSLYNSFYELSTQVSNEQGIQMCKEILDQISKCPDTLAYKEHFEVFQSRSLTMICNYFMYLGQIDSAEFYLAHLKKLKNPDSQYEWAITKALIAIQKFEYQDALEAYAMALKSAQLLSDNSKFYANAMLEMARFYRDHQAYTSAEETLKMLYERKEELETLDLFETLIDAAYVQLYQRKYDSAIWLFNQIDTTTIFANKLSHWAYQAYYNTQTALFIDNNQWDEALVSIEKAVSERGIAEENAGFQPIFLFAQIYVGMGNAEKAETYINKSFNISGQYPAVLLPVLKLDAWLKESKGDYKGAYESLQNYQDWNDSINAVYDYVGDVILKYQVKKDSEIQNLERESEQKALLAKQRINNIILITVIIVFNLILIFGFIYFKKERKRMAMQLEIDQERQMAQYKTSFIQNLSHELRTPLATMSGFLQLILTYNLDLSKIREYANMALQNNDRIITSLNNFLTVLKLEFSGFTLRPTQDNFLQRIKSTVSAFAALAMHKKLSIHFKSNLKDDLFIEYPYDILELIINNLLSNAIKYTPQNRSIYFSMVHENGILKIAVTDEGIGIPKEELHKIFDRFYQSAKHKHSGGFGIGLSLVSQLVTQLKGEISAQSIEEKGSIFLVELPLALKRDSVDSSSFEYEKLTLDLGNEKVEENKSSKKSKVLLVDDDHHMLIYLKELLSTEFECDLVYNGQEALDMVSKHTYDLIISDFRMPQLNGIELKKALNELNGNQPIPFIMITGSVLELPEDILEDIGITDYILKPFDNAELMSRIRFLTDTDLYKKSLYESEEGFNAAQKKVILDIKDVIRKNLSNAEFSAINLALEVGYSHQQLNQIVKKTTGLTLSKIILEFRLLRAYECIIKRQFQTVSEVAYEIGMKSRPYFYKTFEQRFGIKPGDLLKRMNG